MLAPQFTEQGPRRPQLTFWFTSTHAHSFVISVPYGPPIQCHGSNSSSISLSMTFTSILLPTYCFPSPILALDLLELFYLWNLKTRVTSSTSTSILSFSLLGHLLLDLAGLSNPREPLLDSKVQFDLHSLTHSIFPFPAEPTLKANPESIQPFPLFLHVGCKAQLGKWHNYLGWWH